jgi:hypothetical protein
MFKEEYYRMCREFDYQTHNYIKEETLKKWEEKNDIKTLGWWWLKNHIGHTYPNLYNSETKIVYDEIAWAADLYSNITLITHQQILDRNCGISIRTIQRQILVLMFVGMIERLKIGISHTPSKYLLKYPWKQLEHEEKHKLVIELVNSKKGGWATLSPDHLFDYDYYKERFATKSVTNATKSVTSTT